MSSILLIGIGVVVLLVVGGIIGLIGYQRRQDKKLRDAFGPEYDRMVEQKGSRKAAHAELESQLKRIKSLQIHPLTREDGEHYRSDWITTQAEFVEEPCKAISDADRLVTEVMLRRGYPISDYEERVADLSIKDPSLVEDYRSARDNSLDKEEHVPDTEELREAMLCYKDVFNGLLVTEKV